MNLVHDMIHMTQGEFLLAHWRFELVILAILLLVILVSIELSGRLLAVRSDREKRMLDRLTARKQTDGLVE